jgi:hypothetical protein
MKLKIDNGSLYLDNMFICYVEIGDVVKGKYHVEARYSHAHGEELVHVDTLGWMGAQRGCDIILGRVKSAAGLLPCAVMAERVLQNVALAQDVNGETIKLEVV